MCTRCEEARIRCHFCKRNFHRPNDRGDNDPVTKNVFVARSSHVVETSPYYFAYYGCLMEYYYFIKGEGMRLLRRNARDVMIDDVS